METPATLTRENIVGKFNESYYASKVWADTFWLGVNAFKTPTDLWVYQEMIHELRPDLVIETGTYWGGSALFFAHVLEMVGCGQVVTIDVEERKRPSHPRLSFLLGSSVAPEILDAVGDMARGKKVMVVLDSDHSKEHVMAELRAYSPLVTPGSYLVVEDTNTKDESGTGPVHAVLDFLGTPEGAAFEIDRTREKHGLTFCPCGFLKRKEVTS